MSLPLAIVLAGGFGTRLQSVVADVPKPMAPVNGRPFLEILLDHLHAQGVPQVWLATGYKHEVIEGHFGSDYRGLPLRYSVEREPLGTGGAILQALGSAGVDRAFVLNGDTHCPVDLSALYGRHLATAALLTLSLVAVEDAGRFGRVETDAEGRVTAFREKAPGGGPGWINAGVYAVERALFESAPSRPRFSFETEVMQPAADHLPVFALPTQAPFIDIGIPSEYARAQELFA